MPKLIGSMGEGVKRIRDISNSLRTFSRADSDYPVSCDLHDGIDSTIMILKHRFKANETHPEIQVIRNYGDLPEIKCYAGQLNQVFMNLLSNSIDALEESNYGRNYQEIINQIVIIATLVLLRYILRAQGFAPLQFSVLHRIENRYTTELSTDQQQVIIQICDNGIGMDAELQETIFNYLFTTKGVGKGTGLGLAIARQIIEEKHHGGISFTSELGQGTKFAIVLPINN